MITHHPRHPYHLSQDPDSILRTFLEYKVALNMGQLFKKPYVLVDYLHHITFFICSPLIITFFFIMSSFLSLVKFIWEQFEIFSNLISSPGHPNFCSFPDKRLFRSLWRTSHCHILYHPYHHRFLKLQPLKSKPNDLIPVSTTPRAQPNIWLKISTRLQFQ